MLVEVLDVFGMLFHILQCIVERFKIWDDLITASYTRRVDLILLDQQIRILPADAKHFLKMLHRHHIRVVLEHRQIPLRLSVRLFLNQSAGCDLAHSCPLLSSSICQLFEKNTICKERWSFPGTIALAKGDI